MSKKRLKDTNLISDGYHTFGELYEHRIRLFITLCKAIYNDPQYQTGQKAEIWASLNHSDESNFNGWFILGIGEEKGKQIWHNRTKKWMKTMIEKPEEEKKLINSKKVRTLENYQRKHGKEEGLKQWIKVCNKQSKAMRKIDIGNIENFNDYIYQVRKISEREIKIHGLNNIELRNKSDFHLDHKVSICFGFNNNILPEVIGSIYNLEIIPAYDNLSKNTNNSIKPEKLLEIINEK